MSQYPYDPNQQYPNPYGQQPQAPYGQGGYAQPGDGQPPYVANPYAAQPFGAGYPAALPDKHSGLGIASFILALLSGVGLIVSITIAVLVEQKSPGALDHEGDEAVALGVAVIVGAGMCLLGLILGIIGCCQKDRKRVFAVIGTVLNGLILFGLCGLMSIGLAAMKGR
jgi:hypothetical protein